VSCLNGVLCGGGRLGRWSVALGALGVHVTNSPGFESILRLITANSIGMP
jgi:hypothetical protein